MFRRRPSPPRPRAPSGAADAIEGRPRPRGVMQVHRPTLAERLRYRTDAAISRSPFLVIAWVGIAALASAALGVLVLTLFRIEPDVPPNADGTPVDANFDFWERLWAALTRTLDPGTVAGDLGWPYRIVGMAMTLAGLIIVTIFIGAVTNGIQARLDRLRRGRSFVVESGHTVLLGWSPKIFSIISELCIANESQRRPRIAILAAQDKVAMEEEIHQKVGHTGRTRVVCRTGSPIDLYDLRIVNPAAARAIIIIAPEGPGSDAHVLKTILALTSNADPDAPRPPIVAEVRSARNLAVAKMIGRDEVQLVLGGDLIARITAQTCRQSGLSVVYSDLLDFEGDEFYFHKEPRLAGLSYGEALFRYEKCAVVGIRYADGSIQLNPPPDRLLGPGDQVIAIAEDDSRLDLAPGPGATIDDSAIVAAPPRRAEPERTLVLGWNARAATILAELDLYVAPGSSTTVVSSFAETAHDAERLKASLKNQSFTLIEADTTSREVLDGLGVPSFNHVIVLCYADAFPPQEADARTLVTLLHLRDIGERGGHTFSIVTEMLDVRNRELAEVARPDDFIVSERLVSLMLAQVSENPELNVLFARLFEAAGAEIYLKPVTDYVVAGRPVTFATLVEASRRRGETAIGYRLAALAADAASTYGVALNPPKSAATTFTPADRIIVLSES